MHYDYIPSGKKPIRDINAPGGWKLVDLKKENPEDMKIMYEEAIGREQCLAAENKKLIQMVKLDYNQNDKLKNILALSEKDFNKLIKDIKK